VLGHHDLHVPVGDRKHQPGDGTRKRGVDVKDVDLAILQLGKEVPNPPWVHDAPRAETLDRDSLAAQVLDNRMRPVDEVGGSI
jgi:hypothetical protein